MGKAIHVVFNDAWHGLCNFHIMQNATKHLPLKKKEDTNILSDFSACMYDYEDEATFEEALNILRSKVHKQTWLDSIYKVKEKWAQRYMRNVYTLRMRSTQLSENLNNDLKKYLKSDFDIIHFSSM
jgi:transposase-like protein